MNFGKSILSLWSLNFLSYKLRQQTDIRIEFDNIYGIVARFKSDDIYKSWLITAEYLASVSKLLNEDQTWE